VAAWTEADHPNASTSAGKAAEDMNAECTRKSRGIATLPSATTAADWKGTWGTS
jgi:hypothetical protein